MTEDSPNTVRPRKYPEDLRAVVAEALPKIAEELDSLRFQVGNGNLSFLQELGDLKFSFESFRDRITEASEMEQDGHSKTHTMLSRLLGEMGSLEEDFETFKTATNEAIAEIRRRTAHV